MKTRHMIVAGAALAISMMAESAPQHENLGLPPVHSLAPAAEIALGKKLFFDTRLSANGTISCASCHSPTLAFADGRATAKGLGDQHGTRNTPSLVNSRFSTTFFWDGRTALLETQVMQPLFNPLEHGLPDEITLLRLLVEDDSYPPQFQKVFSTTTPALSTATVARVLAAYVRSLTSGNSAFDQYVYGDNPHALSASQVRGLELFRGPAQCASCHLIDKSNALLSDQKFHSLGVGMPTIVRKLPTLISNARKLDQHTLGLAITRDHELAALGRFLVTGKVEDIGKFKTPSLRNVALTAPYMHDGSVASLEEAVEREVYYRGLQNGRPLVLTPEEKNDLVAFLQALNSTPRENLSAQSK